MTARGARGGRGLGKLFSHDHLTDEALLRWMDGELRPQEMAAVASHVQLCWSCRGRRQAFEEGILNVVAFHATIAAPYLPPSEDSRAVFLDRLARVSGEREPVPATAGLWARLSAPWFSLATQPFALALLVVLTLALGLVYASLRNPLTVSAEELLRLTSNAETRSLAAAPNPVVIQRVRVRMGKLSLERTLYRDMARHRTVSRTTETAPSLSSLQAVYTSSKLDWDSLMDSRSFAQWQARSGTGNDRVTRLSRTSLRLEVTATRGDVKKAHVIVRTPDFHIVDETFTLRDDRELELAELSYTVVPVASLAADLFLSAEPSVASLAKPSVAVGSKRPIPRADLLDAAIAAEAALHSVGADLGEQITLETRKDGPVVISGIVEDQARKRQLLAVLDPLPFTRVRVFTLAEAAEQARHAPAGGAHGESLASSQALAAGPPLMADRLEARFPDKNQRIEYVNQALSLAQIASSRSWALNRLADRYPPSSVALLSDEARGKLQGLLSDHLTALREDVSALSSQLGEVLSRSSNTASANTSLTSPPLGGSGLAAEGAGDWRARVHRIHSSTEAVHEAIGSLLASSQHGDAEPIEINLRTAITELETELQSLNQNLRKTTLQ